MHDTVNRQSSTKLNTPPNAAGDSTNDVSLGMPKLEVPAAFRALTEFEAQTKENCERMKTASQEMTGLVENAYTVLAKGAADYGFKVIEMMRANTRDNFDLACKLMTVKAPSEAIEVSTAHARKRFETISSQGKELFAISQQIARDSSGPVATGMSKLFTTDA